VACRDFDGQVVRLERLEGVADKFVRVRLTRIDNLDLNLFEFDYDLTFTVFFLSADGKVYARYGGRDAEDPDRRQSLAGLRHTMESVLQMHARADREFAPRTGEAARFTRDLRSFGRRGRCMHCHQVKEALNYGLVSRGEWVRDLAWRYPLPENVGIELEVDRGNVVQAVRDKSPGAAAGMAAGDVVRRLNGVPVHSIADVQFALDIATRVDSIEAAWQRGEKVLLGKLSLPDGWRKGDVSWRPSMQRLVASARLSGTDLSVEEKKALGLAAGQVAFRQKDSVSAQAQAAGIRGGDVIVGVDGQVLEMDVDEFVRHVRRSYLVGDKVIVNVLREGKRLNLAMTLQR
jgi:S1-C subfamily serine protease